MSDTYDNVTSSETEQDGTKAKDKSDKDKLDIARKQWDSCEDAFSDNYRLAKDDLLFLKGGDGQWDPQSVLARKAYALPMITVNVLPNYLHQITNDQRMNTPAIKVHPVDDNADIETAKIFQGLIRHIEYDSNADVAEDTAVNSAAAIGFGYFRLVTEFESADKWEQVIKYKRIRNALSVKVDPLSVEPDGSDMQYCFIEYKENKTDFKRKWPKANASNDAFFNDGSETRANYAGWLDADSVLVCEWYCIEKENAEVVELTGGISGFADEILPEGGEKSLPEGIKVERRREGTRSKVMWRRITGVDILEETEIKCKWIPVFPVYGDEIDIEGEVYRSGIVRNAKGPAQMYNTCITSATQEIGLRGKNPYIMAEGQEEGHEDEFAMANRVPLPYVTYKPVALGDKLAPPPQRNPMADFPRGFMEMAMHAADDIKKTTGLFDASLGARGNATSGKQELAQQREGDVANFHYMDGLLRSLRHCGRCLVCMIPHYYDTQRTIRILGEDDSAEHVTINQPNPDVGAVQRTLRDLTAGTYDVTVTSGPSFTTMRQESAEFFTSALQAAKDPATAAVLGYLAMKNQDIPGGDIATKMMETLLPPPAKAVIDEEKGGDNQEQEPIVQLPEGPLPVSQVPQAMDVLKQKIMALTEAAKQADAAKSQEAALKQQHAVNEQQLEPQRLQTEREKAAAESAKANASLEQAKAATIQAQADLIRATIEKETLPDKIALEAHQEHQKSIQMEEQLRNPQKEPETPAMPTAEEIAAELAKTRPKDMTITAPSGQVYKIDIGTMQ